jgi:hypothetical protein
MKVPGIETARVAKNLTFSVAEYQDRLSRVRAQMASGPSTCWSSSRRRTSTTAGLG